MLVMNAYNLYKCNKEEKLLKNFCREIVTTLIQFHHSEEVPKMKPKQPISEGEKKLFYPQKRNKRGEGLNHQFYIFIKTFKSVLIYK